MEERRSGGPTIAILAMVGGLLAVVGSALVWFSVRADTSGLGGRVMTRSVRGTEASDGTVTLIAGLVVIVAAVVLLLVREGSSRKGVSVLVSVGGLVAGGLGLYDVATAKRQVIDAAVKQVGHIGFSGAQIRALLERAFDTGILRITPGTGIVLVMAGGALAVVSGVAGLFSRAAVPAGAGAEAAPSVPPPLGVPAVAEGAIPPPEPSPAEILETLPPGSETATQSSEPETPTRDETALGEAEGSSGS